MLAVVLVEVSRVGGWFERALLAILGPIAAAFVHLLLSPKRELAADRVAAGLCGSADGLVDALLRLDRASDLVTFEASPATEPLYTVNPFAEEGLAHCSSRTRRSSAGSRLYGRQGSPGRSDHIVTSRRTPRCSIQARSTPSRVKPHFSATRSEETLPGKVPSCIRGSSSSSNAHALTSRTARGT
jgi:hypothetical protein